MFLEMLENPGAIIAIGCSNGSWVSPAFVVLLSAVLHASRRHFESVTLIFVVVVNSVLTCLTVWLTLQILGVETCPFIFSLSGPASWRNDIKDIREWHTCRSAVARNLVFTVVCLGGSLPLGRYLLCTNNTEERHQGKGPGTYEHQCGAMGLHSSEDLETLLGPDQLLPEPIHGISVTWPSCIVDSEHWQWALN